MTSLLTLDVGRLLHEPLDPTHVKFRPKTPKPRDEAQRDGPWYCLALAYYEIWDLVKILDTHVYAQWHIEDQQVLFSDLDNRVVVWLILEVCGVRMVGVGEEFLGAETKTDENAVTSAWAQAFRRACALFGLGLNVYFFPNLPSRYVAYDPAEKKVSVPADVLLKLAEELYRKTPALLLRGTVGVEGQSLAELQTSLIKPFGPQEIDFLPLPGSRRRESENAWVCEANPYIDVWSLVRRLNAVAYGVWSVPRVEITLARNTAILTVWLKIGENIQPGVWQEPLTVMERQGGKAKAVEDVVTTAYSYAFKRACHLHGLALYLRFLAPPTVPLVNNRIGPRSIDLALELYRKHGLPLGENHEKEHTKSKQEGTTPSNGDVQAAQTRIGDVLSGDAKRVQQICAHYQVSGLGELSHTQLFDLDRRLQELSRPGTVSPDQIASLNQLCQRLGKKLESANTLSYNRARTLLQELTVTYREQRDVQHSSHT